MCYATRAGVVLVYLVRESRVRMQFVIVDNVRPRGGQGAGGRRGSRLVKNIHYYSIGADTLESLIIKYKRYTRSLGSKKPCDGFDQFFCLFVWVLFSFFFDGTERVYVYACTTTDRRSHRTPRESIIMKPKKIYIYQRREERIGKSSSNAHDDFPAKFFKRHTKVKTSRLHFNASFESPVALVSPVRPSVRREKKTDEEK